MSEERSGARETLDEAREMREHEQQAMEHDAAEKRPGEPGRDDTEGPDTPTPWGGAGRS
jgi:hypothetical protein